MKPSFYLLLFGLVIVAKAHAAEFDTYRYKLMVSKDDKVCKHMERVYNTHFMRPHVSFDEMKDKVPSWLVSKSQPFPYGALLTFYPTSPELEAVQWRLMHYSAKTEPRRNAMLVTDLDINNDGKREIVIKSAFYTTWDSIEELKIFRPNEIELNAEVTINDLVFDKTGKYPPSYIWGGAVVRPFIFKGTTYLHIYDYKRPGTPGEVVNAFSPPEKVWIRKLKQGGRTVPESTPAEYEDICEFDMIVTNKYIPKIN